MEALAFFIGCGVLAFLFGPWMLLWRRHLKHKRIREEDQQGWQALTERVLYLEAALHELQNAARGFSPGKAAAETIVPSVASFIPPPLVVPPVAVPPPSPIERVAVEPTPERAAAERWISEPRGEEPPPSIAPASFPQAPPGPPAGAVPPQEPPRFGEVEHRPSFFAGLKSTLNVEETLGTHWLNKLGIILLVVGIAFFLAYQLKTLGPGGKVLAGYLLSVAMLGIGIWFERNDRYRILARAGVGGGWALLFFTTYAVYHVPATQVLFSQTVDLVLMLVVATGMVWQTLRYRSQVVTGLAFLLAFLTVAISHDTVYSLLAGAVLAAGLVAVVGRRQWFELEILGILASYLNHYLWLHSTIEPRSGHRRPFPEFAASAGILLLYWAIFRLSYVFRRPGDDYKERISTAAALLNPVLLLLLFKYQSTHPEWAFWALLAIGGIEALLGQLPVTRRRRSAVVVLSTLGVVLLIAAFPFRYSGTRLSLLWLMESEALLLIGVWTKEIVFRRLGLVAGGVVAGQMLSVDAARICGMRMDGASVHSDLRLAILFAGSAIVFYANAHWVYRRWAGLFATKFDEGVMQRLSHVAALMAFVGLWIAFPESWTAVAWAALGLGLAWLGRRFTVPALTYQANFLALASVVRMLAVNLGDSSEFHGMTGRLVTVSLVALLLYVTSRWSWAATCGESRFYFAPVPSWSRGSYTWTASFFLTLLAWYELRPIGVAVAWMAGGMVLFAIGSSGKSLSLRLQAYLLFIASFLRIFFVNLNASGHPGELSPRFYTVLPISLAFFYAYWRLHERPEELTSAERKGKVGDLCCYLGTITIASLMRFEIAADWVAVAWAGLVFVLLALAWRSRRRLFLHQALLVGGGVLFRTALHNLYQRSYFPAPSLWESRLLCVGAVVALLFASLPFAFRLRDREPTLETGIVGILRSLGKRPEQTLFFIAIGLLTALLGVEMRHGMVTVSWGVEGVGIFLFAMWVGERSFRLAGLGLLLLCVGKILIVDIWGLNPRDRYLTLIVLGGALLLVSFLYTRNREALRQYL